MCGCLTSVESSVAKTIVLLKFNNIFFDFSNILVLQNKCYMKRKVVFNTNINQLVAKHTVICVVVHCL